MNKGIGDIKNIGLTHSEKKQIFNNIINAPIASPYASQKSLWDFAFGKFAYVTGIFLILAMTGGTLAYADEFSLPGDFLYGVKRNITEPIRDAFTTTAVARAEWEARKAIRRLNEAEDLARKNNLTSEQRVSIENDFNENVAAFHANLRAISTSTNRGQEIKNLFEQLMKGHSGILKTIGSYNTDGAEVEINTLGDAVVRAVSDKLPEAVLNKAVENIERTATSERESKGLKGDTRGEPER